MVKRISFWFIAAFLVCISSETIQAISPQLERITLNRHKPIAHELSGGQTHFYEIYLADKEYANLLIEQKGIDVVIHLTGLNDKTISTFSSEYTTEGEEKVEIVAGASGLYRFDIASASRTASPGSYEIRVAEIRPSIDKDRLLAEARKLKANFALYMKKGIYEDARVSIERALEISESVLGPDDPFIATLLYDLGDYYEKKQSFGKAGSALERALGITQKSLGEEHPRTVEISRMLALVYWQTNEVAESERLANFAYETSQKILGTEHFLVAQCALVLAQITDDLPKKEQLLKRSLMITEKTVGPEHYFAAYILNSIGVLHKDLEDYEGAEKILQQALAIGKKSLGPTNLNLAVVQHNLGLLAQEQKNYPLAEEYYSNAIRIIQTDFGNENPRLVFILNNLANIYRAKGEYSKSLETHLNVLRISEKIKGPNHPMSMTSLGNIARTYAAQGNIVEAIRFQKRVDSVIDKNIDLNLAIGSEQEKVSYMQWVPERTDRTVSLNTQLAPQDPVAIEMAALVLLQRKGRVLDSMSESYASLRDRAVPEAQVLFKQLNETISELANLVLNGPKEMSSEEHLKRVSELEDEKGKLESAISQLSSEFRAQVQPVTIEGIQALIPEDAALIEFAVYRPFDPKAQSNKEAYKEPRYIAYVLHHNGKIQWHDLGTVQDADAAIQIFRDSLREPKRKDVKQLARRVDEIIMRPVRQSVGSATHLIISPDGELNLIPFEALIDENDRFLIEKFSCTYLTSGRDLLRLRVSRNSKMSSIVIANPEFGEAVPVFAADSNLPKQHPAKRESVIIGTNLSDVYFGSLIGTAREAEAIERLLEDANVLTGTQASESSLKRISAPQILHIATHGFFLTGGKAVNNDDRVINPLLRSGLALAGANLRSSKNDDGILTALEASSLNLWGTKLVTLSACDTGLGEVKNGDGVYGLRRAFLLAGAESLVMSLWPVSDFVTREIMIDYYQSLKTGLGRGEALRKMQLNMLKKKNREHPFFWASFIQLGEWRSLKE